jgi:DNA-binding NarL/FixJ family response regulator
VAAARILIADDHPIVRGAVRQAVVKAMPDVNIDEAGDFDSLTAFIAANDDVDLVLLDLSMPGTEGFSGLLYMRAQHPQIPVVIVSAKDEPGVIRRSLEFGASGYVPKTADPATIVEAIRAVLGGGSWTPPDFDRSARASKEDVDLVRRLATLTPQQVRVLMMLSQGLLNKQIAYELGVSEATVKAHVSAILAKLGVDSRTQAVIAAGRIAGAGTSAGEGG